jgi:hypothetical protein
VRNSKISHIFQFPFLTDYRFVRNEKYSLIEIQRTSTSYDRAYLNELENYTKEKAGCVDIDSLGDDLDNLDLTNRETTLSEVLNLSNFSSLFTQLHLQSPCVRSTVCYIPQYYILLLRANYFISIS